MAETWPASLDQCFLIGGFSQQNRPVVIRSEVDAGPPKVRRRYTKPIRNVTGAIKADKAQTVALNTFFDVTLQGGVKRFQFTNPITDTLEEFRFIDPPVITPLTSNHFLINMNLEQF